MPASNYTRQQQLAQWAERISLENHHESSLPSQRYRITRELPVTMNPIIPQDVSTYVSRGGADPKVPKHLELNAPRARPPQLGNPMFGYSTHPIPAPVVDNVPSPRHGAKASAETMARLAELQAKLQEERKARKALEAQIKVARERS